MTCRTHGRRFKLVWGPVPIRQCFSLFNTNISDPPCRKAEVCLTVRFKKPTTDTPDSGAEFPIRIRVDNVIASSESGLTFQDVLITALNTQGRIEC